MSVDDADETLPERTCIATRVVRPPDEMIRFVLDPEGRVTPDIRKRLPGRGVWVTATARAVAEAMRRKAFPRAFKAPAVVADTLVADIEALLTRDAVQAFAIANKAGQVLTGFDKVATALSGGRAIALIHAAEAAADGRRKLEQAARRGGAGDMPTFDFVQGGDLDLALGRGNVIHAALLAGPAGENALARWRRLAHFRSGFAENPPGAGTETACDATDRADPAD
jgi:predicted RNA-binding protein YlxR (DUF448 family)